MSWKAAGGRGNRSVPYVAIRWSTLPFVGPGSWKPMSDHFSYRLPHQSPVLRSEGLWMLFHNMVAQSLGWRQYFIELLKSAHVNRGSVRRRRVARRVRRCPRAPDTKRSVDHRFSPHSERHRRAALGFYRRADGAGGGQQDRRE